MKPMPNQSIRGEWGFTLVELMVALVVLAILVSLGLPSFRDLIASQRERAAASALYDSLVLARAEAIKRNTIASLTVKDADLASGWTVTLADATVLRSQENFNGLSFNPNKPAISYNQFGRPQTGGDTNIKVTGTGTSTCWQVTVGVSGRPSVSHFDQGCP
jgi:type IV fimbrial biogenesis protein FimT